MPTTSILINLLWLLFKRFYYELFQKIRINTHFKLKMFTLLIQLSQYFKIFTKISRFLKIKRSSSFSHYL